MITIQTEQLTIGYEAGLIETTLSNGWTIKQCFQWYVDYDGVQVEYDPDAMEVIGAEDIEEYSDEELAALDKCEWHTYDLKTEIYSSKYYRQAKKEFKESSDPYVFYGVSEKDFY
jgi:hypothetical protein|nr:MAG TPA: hypothetical protein [Bacteriophage sp.]